ncbi:methyltransferase domain-containing protein [Lacimicrobium sp. SS2-24]|uniref:methyltransferase domain-containing protein n=1 Tax=Lacimicrobium sp. SS2-24 TaxID=2005569 RepID=UPI000B4AAE66|nr:methyltransferase domain-containing protein [Lacimicrobium sp. SS2-24]
MFMHQDTQTSALHEIRLNKVFALVKASGATNVLDLGCGSGSFLWKLMQDPQFVSVVGLEQCGESLRQARNKLQDFLNDKPVREKNTVSQKDRLSLICGSYTEPPPGLNAFQMAVMLETIEHVVPGQLSVVEHQVFALLRPAQLILTTPNREYNCLYGLQPGEYRDPDHKFEWDRARFRQWSRGVATRNGYKVRFLGVGDEHPELGPPSQVAWFEQNVEA